MKKITDYVVPTLALAIIVITSIPNAFKIASDLDTWTRYLVLIVYFYALILVIFKTLKN